VLKKIWCQQQEKNNGERSDNAGELGAGAGRLCNGCARGAAADGETLKERSGQISGA